MTFILVLAAALTGCATEYQPRGKDGGYSETALAPDVWQVTFESTPYTMNEQIADFSLLRSAELTLRQGYSHFVLSPQPGPHVEVRMFRTPPQNGYTLYNARAVCDKLGAKYEIACAKPL